MGIRLSKNLKQNQSLKLTPSLKKSIDLLQLSRFELIRKIENEIIENPFLENKENCDYSVDIGEFSKKRKEQGYTNSIKSTISWNNLRFKATISTLKWQNFPVH